MREIMGKGFRPSRWAWTTLTGTVLLGLLLFAVVVMGSDYGDALVWRQEGWYRHLTVEVLEALERGFVVAIVPTLVVVVVVWQLRRHADADIDERASAMLGALAVSVLSIGLLCAAFHVPDGQGTRLSVETALSLVGAALLIASVWVRHVPRAWTPT